VPVRDRYVANRISSRFSVGVNLRKMGIKIPLYIRATHKDRTEERFKVMTTWDLISVNVGTETAAVMLPGVLGLQ
jgi:hypothetical protein